jgi:hypothetical protein
VASETFTLFVQSMEDRDEKPWSVGTFPTQDEALSAATERLRKDLQNLYSEGHSAKDLFSLWSLYGEDVFISPDDAPIRFSGMDYVRLAALDIASDTSRPLLLEVTNTDRINTAGGYPSPPDTWVFWVKAPATYKNADWLIRQASDELYRQMSQQAREGDGSTYTLLEQEVRELSPEEAEEERQKPDFRRTIYVVQNNGSFVKEEP